MKPGLSKIAKYQSGNLILKSTEQLGPLILGDCNSAMDKKIQKQFKIQTVISIGQQAMPIKEKLPENCKHFFFDVHDNKSQKVPTQLFDEISKLIEEGRKIGGVLVHCYAGVSRSSTFVIAYVMQKFLKSYDDAKQQVKTARNCIYPNDGFVHQLKSYQKVLELRQKQRLRKIQQQKNRLIELSLVQSARKSIRGGVRGAAMSPQKVKQINQQRDKKSFEIFVQPLLVKPQIKTEKQIQKSDEIAKIKNNVHHILTVKQNKQKQKILPSRSIFLTKSFSISQKPKQQIKLPKVKESSHTQRSKIQNKQTQNRYYKVQSKFKVQTQIQKKSQSIPLFIKKQKFEKDDIQKISTSSKTKSYSTRMRQSKSVFNSKRQKSNVSQIDQTLLNEHQKQIKKIYQSKITVK